MKAWRPKGQQCGLCSEGGPKGALEHRAQSHLGQWWPEHRPQGTKGHAGPSLEAPSETRATFEVQAPPPFLEWPGCWATKGSRS